MRIIFISILLGCTYIATAQNKKDFTRINEFYIRGNTQVIGNNILSNHKSKPIDATDEINDEIKMRYVDVDSDASTFNSSSANLTIPENASIQYAALYWVATYPTEKGVKRIKGNRYVYEKNGKPTKDIQEIKLQIPGGQYIPIRGELVFDGKNGTVTGITSSRPYTCYKDITSILKENQTVNGTYTVANIAASQGYISGGSSAGWMLYIVYENEEEPLQYITTYNGFERTDRKGLEINFGNFKTSEKKEIQTAVTISALEGDSTLKKDQIGIYHPEEGKFITLDNAVRASDNFFNSSITINNSYYTDRSPNSKNTLGFDIAKISIPKEINSSIANQASGVKMQFKTRSDRYYLFFVAFQTTLNESFYKDVLTITKEEASPSEKIEISPVEVIVEKIQIEEEVQEQKTIPEIIPEESIKTPSPIDETLVKIIDKKPTEVPNVLRGYYIISNVFSSKANAEKWAKKLKVKNIQSNTFLRPENNFYYVSIGNNEDPVLLYEVLKRMRKDKDLKDAWILKINIQ